MCDVDEAYCHDLTESFRNYTSSYARGIRTFYILVVAGLVVAMYDTAAHDVDNIKIFNSECRMVKRIVTINIAQ